MAEMKRWLDCGAGFASSQFPGNIYLSLIYNKGLTYTQCKDICNRIQKGEFS